MADEARPEADRVADAPHPRESLALAGQAAAEAAFLDAWAAGRLHHAWLLTGPRGVGKATLAYRIARALIAQPEAGGLFGPPAPPETLDVDPEHPAARRIAAGAEPRLHVLSRAINERSGKLNTVIRVEEARRLKSFFGLSAADGGWRVAIIDSADEMNASAANAALKLLEEPPEKAMLLLISHAPAGLLPTIRSRCRALKLGPLGPEDLASALAAAGRDPGDEAAALAALGGGSAGEAIRLLALGGPEIYADLVALMGAAPGADRGEMIRLAEACAGREAEPRYDLTARLALALAARLARAGALGPPAPEAAPGEAALAARLSPCAGAASVWADLHARCAARIGQARAVNLDPAQVMLDTFIALDGAAETAVARAR